MKKRPIGISILAILYILDGGGKLVLLVYMYSIIEEFGISSLFALIVIAFRGILGLAAGIGMWTGKKWGWWLGAFYLTFSVARNAKLLMIPSLIEQFGAPEAGAMKYYIKHGGRIIIHSLLVLYFFKENVVKYFGTEAMNPWKKFGYLLGATIFIYIILTAISSVVAGNS